MAITTTRDGGVGIVTIDCPPANAYNKRALRDLAEAVDAVRIDDAVRCVIVKSGVDKFFCSGADISVLAGASAAAFAGFVTVAHETVDMIERTPKIFIAAIDGHCVGGGLELALACDLRFAAEGSYKLGLAEVGLGLSPGMGGTQRLPRLIPKGRALQLMISGEMVTPAEAHALGIVERLFPARDLWPETLAYAQRLAQGPSLAQGTIKLSVNQGLEGGLSQGLALERANQNNLFASEDAAEGIKAFVEKREAVFRGR